MKLRRLAISTLFVALTCVVTPSSALAIPILQLYVEGGTYDDASETWVVDSTDAPLRLWTIGNVSGEGGKGTISNVRLAIAYEADAAPLFTLTPSTTLGYGGYLDPSTPTAPVYLQTRTDGSTPKLGDGQDLASHGVYGSGTDWQEFALGNFSLTDSQMADFIDTFPVASGVPSGQINVYEVTVASFVGTLHFDLYNGVQAGNKVKYVFAPFSHDAEGKVTVPEPTTLLLLSAGATALLIGRRRRS